MGGLCFPARLVTSCLLQHVLYISALFVHLRPIFNTPVHLGRWSIAGRSTQITGRSPVLPPLPSTGDRPKSPIATCDPIAGRSAIDRRFPPASPRRGPPPPFHMAPLLA